MTHHKNIFITGGTGFFGHALLKKLLIQNNKTTNITLLSRHPEKFIAQFPQYGAHPKIAFLQGDIKNFSFPTEQYTDIIHAATDTNQPSDFKPLALFENIVKGTEHVLNFARQQPIARFLYVSSGGVYGEQPQSLKGLPETWLGAPQPNQAHDLYSEAKRMAEMLCSVYVNQYQLPIRIARCFSFVGPFMPTNGLFAIGNFIRDALINDEIKIKGDGLAIRSYLFSDDLAEWLLTILDKGENNEAYNVGSEQAINLIELAETVRQIINPNISINIMNLHKTVQRLKYIPDTQKAQTQLQLTQKIPLEKSIQLTAKWLSTQLS